MIPAEIGGDRIVVDAPPTYKNIIKRVPGARYSNGAWSVPLSWAACLQLRAELGSLLVVGPALNAWAAGYKAWRAWVLGVRGGDHELPLPEGLYPFQRDGAAWADAVGRGLLGDETGTGKTVQIAAALDVLAKFVNPWPALVVCNNGMKLTWQAELARWAPDVRVQVVSGTAAKRRKLLEPGIADLYVLNWEALRLHSRLAPYGSVELSEAESRPGELDALHLRTFVADEAHRVADPHSKATRAYWNLMHQAEYRLPMTGTYVVNRGSDMFGIMHGVAPHEYPVRSSWVERYFDSGQGRHGFEIRGLRPETAEEFFEILQPRLLRRTKREVLPQLPDKLPPQRREVEMDSKLRKLYDAIRAEMVASVDGEILVEKAAMNRDNRLTMLAAGYPVVKDGEVLALTEPSPKTGPLMELLQIEMPDANVVVFMQTPLLVDLVAGHLDRAKISYVRITADVKGDEREEAVARFQRGEARVALCTFGVGAESITLTRANVLVRLQRSWSAVKNDQAEDRVWRIGQEREVIVVDFVTRDTIEDAVIARDAEKSEYRAEVEQGGAQHAAGAA